MNTREAIKEIMDYSKNNNVDINMAYIKLNHAIATGEKNNISKKELEQAHKFIAYNYNLAVDKYKGILSDEDNEKYEKELKEYE